MPSRSRGNCSSDQHWRRGTEMLGLRCSDGPGSEVFRGDCKRVLPEMSDVCGDGYICALPHVRRTIYCAALVMHVSLSTCRSNSCSGTLATRSAVTFWRSPKPTSDSACFLESVSPPQVRARG